MQRIAEILEIKMSRTAAQDVSAARRKYQQGKSQHSGKNVEKAQNVERRTEGNKITTLLILIRLGFLRLDFSGKVNLTSPPPSAPLSYFKKTLSNSNNIITLC